jgi:rSAM/selenodomain-associated transferase 2
MALSISVIIPVLHEQERINKLIAHLKGQGTRGKGQETLTCEIIVADGCPVGSTIESITAPSVICIKAPKGRGNQLAAGSAVATGDIILMLHADTLLPDNALQSSAVAVADGADWGAFRLGIDVRGLGYRIIERAVDLRCTLFSLPYGDQAIFVTRNALLQVGGISPIPLMEDVEMVRRLNRAGLRFTLLPDRVQTSPRRWQQDGIIRRTLQNWWLLLRYLAGAAPADLAKQYR